MGIPSLSRRSLLGAAVLLGPLLRTGSTWGEAMSVSLKAAWQVAKAAHRASAH